MSGWRPAYSDLRAVLQAPIAMSPLSACCPSAVCRQRAMCGAPSCLIGLSCDRIVNRAISGLGDLQSGQGRLGPGDPEHERDARPARDDGARTPRPLPVTERRRAASVSREAGSGSPCAGLSRVSSSFVLLLVLAIGSAAPAAAADVAVYRVYQPGERCSSQITLDPARRGVDAFPAQIDARSNRWHDTAYANIEFNRASVL